MENPLYVSLDNKEKLLEFQALVLKWQKKINLISKSSENDIWHRHILDSVQLQKHLSKEDIIYDLGTGGGFPGIVLSILGYKITMVESDQRKAVFLREVVRLLDLDATVLIERAEEINPETFPENAIITARAFAPLDRILKWLKPLFEKNPKLILLKGRSANDEIYKAKKKFSFEYTAHKSTTNQEAKILIINSLNKNGE